MSELIRILNWAAKERIKQADENRKNGIYDPLNEMTDSILQNIQEGRINKPLRKSQKHRKRKNNP